MRPKDADRLANHADTDQTAPSGAFRSRLTEGAVWSGSTLLVQTCLSDNFDHYSNKSDMSRHTTKLTKWPVRPAKTQISPVWSEPSLCAQWVAKDPMLLHADREDSDQTGLMPRLIWVFAERTCHFVGFVVWRLLGSKQIAECFTSLCHTEKIPVILDSVTSQILLIFK